MHRTVQEYLAAKQFADLGDMELLVRNAHRDQWRETVVMAVGHANEPLRLELINGILDRARAEPKQARRLKLLAVACLETLPSVPDDLRADLDRCLDDLIPPRNTAAARSLATAGEPVLARLPKSLQGLSNTVADATIQTAWLINGPQALDALARYVIDPRLSVRWELSRAWEYFDPNEFAERVWAAMPPGGNVDVRSPAQLATLDRVPPLEHLDANLTEPVDFSFLATHAASLRRLALRYSEPSADLTGLPELPNLQDLILDAPGLADLDFLDTLPPLGFVWLVQCEDIEDYSPLLRFSALRGLGLRHSLRLRSLQQLPPLGAVSELMLSGSRLNHELAALVEAAPNVSSLYLNDCEWLDDLSPLAELKLWQLGIEENSVVGDLRPLNGQADLEVLDVSHTRVADLRPLEGLTKLRILRLTGCTAVTDLRPLAALPKLRHLRIEGIAPGTDLSPLARNGRVTVSIAAGQDVRGGEALGRRVKIS